MLTVRVTPLEGAEGFVARVYRTPADPPADWRVASWGATPFEALHRAKANYDRDQSFDVVLPPRPRRPERGRGGRC